MPVDTRNKRASATNLFTPLPLADGSIGGSDRQQVAWVYVGVTPSTSPNATSTPTITASTTSTATMTAPATSTATQTASATSTPTVSDG